MRLITYNIHKGIGGLDRRYDLDRIIRVLKDVDADLVCLQEVDRNLHRSRFENQPELLADALASVAIVDQLVYPPERAGYGNMILSRWPLQLADQCSIRKGRRKPRGAVMAVIETPQGAMLLVAGHLGLIDRERHWQIDRLLSNPLITQSAHLPTMVAMDTNDWRNTLQAGSFARHGFEQVTTPSSRFRSFPAYRPVASLDKIYKRGPITIESARVVRTKLTSRASDHLPVVVDFSIEELGAGSSI